MSLDVRDTPLLSFLQRRSSAYFAKVEELRDEVAGWLAYTTASFTHYTAHTVDHSDEIIRQVSSLLFHAEDPVRPVVDISSAEAYILCASALLHDTGMVVSDTELRDVLESDGWKLWLSDEPSAGQRLEEIEAFRAGDSPSNSVVRHLIADRQTRYLVLEYVRRTHHRRSVQFLSQNQSALGRFAFDDPVLLQTIGAVCLSHGLSAYQLEDNDLFPQQRDVRGEKVNVRFCAVLLRLGDLLDLSYDRACPLLLNAASPLPAESIAHWTQYRRVTHRLTDPTRLEITATCETQDEHRYLHDWCSWIIAEIANARALMAHANRHAQWSPPVASLGPQGTIDIRPTPAATYVPVTWQLELDAEAVFSRLIHDVNPAPTAFVRELLQNAFDASRCRMYERMVAAGVTPPAYPNHAPDEWLAQFPILVTRTKKTIFNDLSQQDESREVVIIEDFGIGMDRDIITKYLLQVGRSYYTSDDFARRYPFVPTSRFGVGFLSVFANAEEVRVDTLRAGSPTDQALALTLRGPRSYVLTEQSPRAVTGTRIEVTLAQPLTADLVDLIRTSCPRVEFPITLKEESRSVEFSRESPEDFCYEEPSAIDENETMGVRFFPVTAPGRDGEIYIFFLRTPRGEAWIYHTWATYEYPSRHPLARAPRLPSSLTCFHGMSLGDFDPHYRSGWSVRIDYRSNLIGVPLGRHTLAPEQRVGSDDPAVREAMKERVLEHLSDTGYARGADAWKYKQGLIKVTGLEEFWKQEPETIRIFIEGAEKFGSLEELLRTDPVRVLYRSPRYVPDQDEPPPPSTRQNALWANDMRMLATSYREHLLSDRYVSSVERIDSDAITIIWSRGNPPRRLFLGSRSKVADAIPLDLDVIAIRTHTAFSEHFPHVLLNLDHPFVAWVLRVHDASTGTSPLITPAQWENLSDLFGDPAFYQGLHVDRLNEFVERWRALNLTGLEPPGDLPTGSLFRL